MHDWLSNVLNDVVALPAKKMHLPDRNVTPPFLPVCILHTGYQTLY